MVGSERTPTLDDYDKLPYIQAIMKEVHKILYILSRFLIMQIDTPISAGYTPGPSTYDV